MAVTFGCQLNGTFEAAPSPGSALRDLAQQAEESNFDSLWLIDHLVIPRRVTAAYPYAADHVSTFEPHRDIYEPLSVLNYLAACTRRLRLGTHVLIIPYREPIFTAKILATLDVLSGGRLILGAGVGWMAEEFAALGLDTFAERGEVTDEYLRLFKVLWTEENPRFVGKYVRVGDIGFHPKPVQKPHPPIWIGGHTLPALRRAAELGDGWAPIGLVPSSLLQPPEMAAKISRLRAMLRERGRAEGALTLSLSAPVSFAESPSAPRPLLTGHPEQIAADLCQYQALGVRNFIVLLPGGNVAEVQEAMARFAREVMPLIPQD